MQMRQLHKYLSTKMCVSILTISYLYISILYIRYILISKRIKYTYIGPLFMLKTMGEVSS